LLTNKRNQIAECELSETSFACRAAVVQMRSPDESCLVSYLATGNILVNALPRLRPVLMDADFVPYSSSRLSSSMCMSRQGHCLYQPSSGEICKFTISSQYKALVNDMLGLLYVPREMPEMPRTNFFKSLFSGSQSARQSDRDELFGECSAGKPSRGVAKHIGAAQTGSNSTVGGAGLEKLKGAAAGTMGHDVRMAREGLDERGEKLSEMEDRTLNMMNQSESYAQAAHQLAQKFKDKKWYQF
jgi:syntaxin-binding protein 5